MGVRFTLDQLEVLEAVERFGGFAAAAQRLHRATSAVSYAVKTLESALGVALFTRTGRRAVLTDEGRLVLDRAREVLGRARGLERLGADLEGGAEPEVRVVVDGVIPQAVVVGACRRFLARGLGARLALSVESLSGVRERFDREDAHLMIAVDLAGDPRLETKPLSPVEMLLVAKRGHPIHRGKARLDRAAMAEHVEIVVADSGARSAAPPTRLSQIGGPHVVELSDFASKRDAILAGLGFGWLPSHLASRDLARGALALVRFAEGERYTFQPLLARRREAPLGPAARAMREDLLAAARSRR